MNNVNSEKADMLPEYDFTTGVCGKHYQAYRRGHTVTIHQADGTTTVQHFTIEDGGVMLAPESLCLSPTIEKSTSWESNHQKE
jgi:hypothetical protein